MFEENSHSEPLSFSVPVVALPVALYIFDGLIFELYDGGQPLRQFAIRWERLKPIAKIAECTHDR